MTLTLQQHLGRCLKFLELAERAVAAGCFALLTLFMITDVLGRELFNLSFPWAQKAAVFGMIWAGFLGTAIVSAKAMHLKPEIAAKLWPRKWQGVVQTLEHLVVAGFSLTMGLLAAGYVRSSFEMGDVNIVTQIPVWVTQLIIPYAFFSLALRHSCYALLPGLRPVKKLEDTR